MSNAKKPPVDTIWFTRCAGGGRGDSVLACARFGDDAAFAHAQRQKALADGVVELVRARVVEVLALEPDLSAAALIAEPAGVIQGRRTSDVVLQK